MRETNIKKIAGQRICILFEQAQKVARTNPKLAAQYVLSARRIAMSAKIRLPIEFKRRTCKECNTLFLHGLNCRVRVKQKREPHVVITCLNCGNITRILLREKKVQKIEQNNYSHETTR